MTRNIAVLLGACSALLAFGSTAQASGPTLGYYQCYQTTQTTNAATGAPTGYYTKFAGSFWLKAHHKYQVPITTGGGPSVYGQRFSVKGNTLRFLNGTWHDDTAFWHVTGAYHSAGVTMPHSVLNPTRKYKLVLRGRSDDTDVAPPATEFSRDPASSFWYCKKG
ncbi:MAG: hypothetical protein QOJ35_1873 [Solirubrobacteraceae bacterium]|jgi:hypothetical protein|nr:hypothetical protein [Solirubrobacteraceae bacterium]